MTIMPMSKVDVKNLFEMIQEEGWCDYYNEIGYGKYLKALESSITYVAYCEDTICGYIRCREDDGFGVYVYDLLVRKNFRGRGIGRQLITKIHTIYTDQPLYIMSDVDKYYEKLGYSKEGSIFKVI